MKQNSEEYEQAHERMNEASRAYTQAAYAYRARITDDAEYLAARKAFKEAEAAFDAAYIAERDRA